LRRLLGQVEPFVPAQARCLKSRIPPKNPKTKAERKSAGQLTTLAVEHGLHLEQVLGDIIVRLDATRERADSLVIRQAIQGS
jgi:hypothetical protein